VVYLTTLTIPTTKYNAENDDDDDIINCKWLWTSSSSCSTIYVEGLRKITKIMAGPSRVGAKGRLITQRPLTPIFFELFRSRIGLENFFFRARAQTADNFRRNSFACGNLSLLTPLFPTAPVGVSAPLVGWRIGQLPSWPAHSPGPRQEKSVVRFRFEPGTYGTQTHKRHGLTEPGRVTRTAK